MENVGGCRDTEALRYTKPLKKFFRGLFFDIHLLYYFAWDNPIGWFLRKQEVIAVYYFAWDNPIGWFLRKQEVIAVTVYEAISLMIAFATLVAIIISIRK